jgi:hypothetical protein
MYSLCSTLLPSTNATPPTKQPTPTRLLARSLPETNMHLTATNASPLIQVPPPAPQPLLSGGNPEC